MNPYTLKNHIIILILAVSIWTSNSINIHAQNKYDLEQFFREAGELAEMPSKWNLGDWLKLGGLTAGTIAVMQIDGSIRDEVLKDRSYYDTLPLTFGRIFGEPYTAVTVGTYFLVQGANSGNVKNKKLGFEILQAYAYTGLITSLAKIAFGRERPYCAESAFEFEPFQNPFNNDFLSFFSGHTSGAFSLSTVIAANVNGTGWKVLSYMPAFITGFSRIYHNKHWTSDVVMGAAVGYLIGRFVINTHQEKENIFQPTLVQPQPLISFTFPIK